MVGLNDHLNMTIANDSDLKQHTKEKKTYGICSKPFLNIHAYISSVTNGPKLVQHLHIVSYCVHGETATAHLSICLSHR